MRNATTIPILSICIILGSGCRSTQDDSDTQKLPNVIIILADDLGYRDLSCFGSENIKTPNLDKLASEGIKFTNFWTSSNVCSPSRASLLTGRYPQRCGVPFAVGDVYSNLGLQDNEITIAELLKQKGYSTALIGKWHLGIPQGFNYTTHQGFDSNSEFHPNKQGFDLFFGAVGNADPTGRMPIIENDFVVDDSITVARVTDEYNFKAIEFIKENRTKPFFIYFSHTRPHAPWIPNPSFAGKSAGGVYGDMVEELDASVGLITKKLEELGLVDNTIIIFTSDNGAAITEDQRYGSNLPFRGGKDTTWEGGHRVPGILYWPARVTEGKMCDEFVTIMDLFPTISNLAGIKLPEDLVLDGQNIWPLLTYERGNELQEKMLLYYNGFNLQAIRMNNWKIHLPRDEKMLVWWESGIRELKEPLLFNLETDSHESINIASEHPEIVKRLLDEANEVTNKLGSWDTPGSEQKEIASYMDDRTTLQILRSQQNHQNMGFSNLDPSIPEINVYYWEIAKENRRKKLLQQSMMKNN